MTEQFLLKNPAKQKLATGQYVLCMSLRQMRMADAPMIVQSSGFDALYIDQEHSQITSTEASQISIGAVSLGITPLVRVHSPSGPDIARALDGGALGVIVPRVSNRAEAEAAVSEAKFPPQGIRSVSALNIATKYRKLPIGELMELQNSATMVVIMVESAAAIANIDNIATVPGVDVIMIGPTDLSAEYGIPGQTQHPLIMQCYATVADACKRHGKYFAGGGAGGPELTDVIKLGARFLLGSTDVAYLLMGARQAVAAMNAAIQQMEGPVVG